MLTLHLGFEMKLLNEQILDGAIISSLLLLRTKSPPDIARL